MEKLEENCKNQQWLISNSINMSLQITNLCFVFQELTKDWVKLDKLRAQQPDGSSAGMDQQPYEYRISRRKGLCYLTLLLFFAFMGVMLCGCFQIECVT
ncbi:hypothetical protein EUGRSUZ_E01628 [Eucalyptus grandis]|uniref:Uncharacterized protein n=2 Tax=Eucalyptus grandis TaxID=71139 RepID=A0ACC3KUQ1_EUCGR|nr:hypothetical protein EUGRSUZ_E01628 [Eucalyptus grandis]